MTRIFLIIFTVALLATFALVGIIYFMKRKNGKLGVFTKPVALLIIFGHFLTLQPHPSGST